MVRGKLRDLVAGGIPPWSVSALLLVLGSVGLATLLRFLVGLIGRGQIVPFATFFPAVLITVLLAGPWAGAVAAALSIGIVWFAFMGGIGVSPSPADIVNLAMFTIGSATIILLAEIYRRMLRDFRRQKRQFELLTREMEHRGKNTFAVVEAIVYQSLEGERDKAEAIAGRIHAVSSTNDIINSMEGNAAPLRALLESKLSTFMARTALQGPPTLLTPQVARALGLVFHELVVNAIKYGALRTNDGHIDVTWNDDSAATTLVWTETTPTPITAPSQHGFGTRLVTRMMKGIGGTIGADFPPSGIVVTLRFPKG